MGLSVTLEESTSVVESQRKPGRTRMSNSSSPHTLEDRLVDRYGELMTPDELAVLLRYGSSLTLKRAIDARRIPLTLAKVGRQHVVATRDVAAYLIAAGLPGRSD